MTETATLVMTPVELVNKLEAYCKLAGVVELSLLDAGFERCLVETPSPVESEERKMVRTKFEAAIPSSRLLFSEQGHRQVGMRAAVAWERFSRSTLEHVAHFVSSCHKGVEIPSDEVDRWREVAHKLEHSLDIQIAIHGYR